MTPIAEYGDVALGVECALPEQYLHRQAMPRILPVLERMVLGVRHSRHRRGTRPAPKAQRR